MYVVRTFVHCTCHIVQNTHTHDTCHIVQNTSNSLFILCLQIISIIFFIKICYKHVICIYLQNATQQLQLNAADYNISILVTDILFVRLYNETIFMKMFTNLNKHGSQNKLYYWVFGKVKC